MTSALAHKDGQKNTSEESVDEPCASGGIDAVLAKKNPIIPLHIANLVKLISLHDKFNKNFMKWSLLLKEDRDVLVLTVKQGAIIDSSLIYTICMMYPFRIHGPIMVNATMNVEFLHIPSASNTVAITKEITPKNIEYQFLNFTYKRKHMDISSDLGPLLKHDDDTAESGTIHATDIENIRQKMQKSLQQTNNTRTLVRSITNGIDAAGTWAYFQIDQCEKLNLDFIGDFHLAVDDMSIKVKLCCRHHPLTSHLLPLPTPGSPTHPPLHLCASQNAFAVGNGLNSIFLSCSGHHADFC